MSYLISEIEALSLIVDEYYQKIYTDVRKTWQSEFISEISAQDETVTFPFKMPSGVMREYQIGEPPAYRTLEAEQTTIKLKKFGDGISIRTLDWENKMKQSLLMEDVKRLAFNAANLPYERFMQALINGNTDPYYTVHDGEQFFSSTHDIGGYVYDNLDAGALTSDKYFEVKTNMRQVPWGPNGKPLPLPGAKWYLIIPPQLEKTARQILNVTHVYEATISSENVLKNDAQIIVDEEFADSNDWYLGVTMPGAKPMVHLKHATLAARNIIEQISEDSPAVRDHDEYRWSVKTFEEVFPALFFMFTKVVNA